MIKAIPMEDWLRGCIYHDGRHGYVTLPIDKVHQIANYIQRTRRSTTDGLIDLEVVEADRKTEPQTCDDCIWSVCNYNKVFEDKPQTDGYMTAEQTADYHKMLDNAEHKVCGNIFEDEPQERSEE